MLKLRTINRRDFLKFTVWGVGGILSIGLGIPTITYLFSPALRRNQKQNLIHLGSTTKVEPGTPSLFKVKIEEKTGWIVEEKNISAYVLTEDGREFIALSNICTHLGCRVRWVTNQDKFFCPCHNAVFAKDGSVISGPPPRPLDRYPVTIKDNQIYIQQG